MRIAYILTAHDNYLHLERLIHTLNDDHIHFYIHIDKKSELPDNLGGYNNVTLIKNRVKVYWGGFSQVQATLNLLREAVAGNYDYYVFISGTHYPIRPKQQIYDRLSTGGQFLDIVKGFVKHKPETRVSRYYFEGFNRRKKYNLKTILFRGIEFILAKTIKRKYPFGQSYNGANWFAFTHKCTEFVLNFLNEHPQYIKFYSTTHCPDEGMFHTIIGNSEFHKEIKPNLVYTDWSAQKSGPSTIENKHVELFKNKFEYEGVYGRFTPLFARKFTDDSLEVVKKIQRELL